MSKEKKIGDKRVNFRDEMTFYILFKGKSSYNTKVSSFIFKKFLFDFYLLIW